MNKNIGFLLIALCSATALSGMDSDFLPTALESATIPQDCSNLSAWIANHPGAVDRVLMATGMATGAGLGVITRGNPIAADAQFLITSLPGCAVGMVSLFVLARTTDKLLKCRIARYIQAKEERGLNAFAMLTISGGYLGLKLASRISTSKNPYVAGFGGALAGGLLTVAIFAKDVSDLPKQPAPAIAIVGPEQQVESSK